VSKATLDRRAELRNAHPNVLPHAATDEECDALCAKAEKDVAIHLPTFAASTTTWPTLPKSATRLEDLPVPTAAQLERHRRLYGTECVQLPDEKKSVSELRNAGMSVREIARTLGISERTAKTRLRLAA
jgi:DNA-directed RNA polymerase specialized sigma24 family protein